MEGGRRRECKKDVRDEESGNFADDMKDRQGSVGRVDLGGDFV